MNNSVMMTSAGYGSSMTGMLHSSLHLDEQDEYSVSSGSPTYCTLGPAASHIPIYAALQAANDSPPPSTSAETFQFLDQDTGAHVHKSEHLPFTASSSSSFTHVPYLDATRLPFYSLGLTNQCERLTVTNDSQRHPMGCKSEQLKSPSSSKYQSSSNDEDALTREGGGGGGGGVDDGEEERDDISYNDNVAKWLHQQCSGGLAKRRRKVSRVQRLAANHRERRRMGTFNEAFENLRRTIYHESEANKRRKMSRIQTLKSAIQYISDLQQMLDDGDDVQNSQPAEHTSDEGIHRW